jgi:hypothetical protein
VSCNGDFLREQMSSFQDLQRHNQLLGSHCWSGAQSQGHPNIGVHISRFSGKDGGIVKLNTVS